MKTLIAPTCAFALLFSACSSLPTSTPTNTPATAAPAATPANAVLGDYGCPLTTARTAKATVTLGPSPGLPASPAQGEPLVIIGTVYAKDCTPLPGVTLELWQTDADGVYGPGHGSDQMQCCYFQGDVTTDAAGQFQIITVRPGHYAGEADPPPAHIHINILHATGGRMTEFVFRDDPYLFGDLVNSGLVALTPVEGAAIGDIVLTDIAPAASLLPQADGPRHFQIVPEQSEASYQISEKFADFASMVTAVGVTSLIEGELQVDMDNVSAQVLTMTVDLRGLKTDDPQRDEKLADDWLVTNDYPFAYFTSTAIANAPAQYTEGAEAVFRLIGDMTIRDVTRSTTFDVRARLLGDTLTGSAEGTIRMTDFGIEPPNLLGFVKVEDDVLLKVTFTAQE
ncbi:MAG: YceI family protein [Anaerolineales bacterium]